MNHGEKMTRLQAICVFCGSNYGTNGVFREAAAAFGKVLAENNIRLVYGGGGIGLMGQIATAVHDAGGQITGIVPRALEKIELQYQGADEKIVTENMHDRKRNMFDLADAFVVLPGGIGTLEETVEVLSWAYLGFHHKPILLLNIDDYWKPFLALIDHIIEQGFAKPDILPNPSPDELVLVVDQIEDVLPILERALESRAENGKMVASTVY